MAFNQLVVKSYFTGAANAFASPLGSYNGSKIALNTVTSGSTASTAGLVIACAGSQFNIEWDSLAAVVETGITTTSLTVTSKWQVSNDGTNWVDFLGLNCAANVQVAAAGSGSLVTTQYVQGFPGVNPGFPYIRLAVKTGGATGGTGDNVTVAYNFRKRWTGA